MGPSSRFQRKEWHLRKQGMLLPSVYAASLSIPTQQNCRDLPWLQGRCLHLVLGPNFGRKSYDTGDMAAMLWRLHQHHGQAMQVTSTNGEIAAVGTSREHNSRSCLDHMQLLRLCLYELR